MNPERDEPYIEPVRVADSAPTEIPQAAISPRPAGVFVVDRSASELAAVRSALRSLVEAWAKYDALGSRAHYVAITEAEIAARALLDGLSETPEGAK